MTPVVEAANALSLAAFRTRFLPNIRALPPLPTNPTLQLALTLESGSQLSATDFQSCYTLVRLTSSTAYQSSGVGWQPAKKRKEMRLDDMRYLLVKSHPGGSEIDQEELQGFLSFLLTYEDGYEVVYCYELHLAPTLRGHGVGKQLMMMMENVGRNVGVAKAMLTVFVENEAALKFYERLGYEEDEYSPQPRKLRNGVVKDPTYVILSKSLA